mmetsp:Transcript_7938/g.17024  ORF Transcript_7938/g.17024 Transcript_7938/m.17024 type:complete len:425 (+) Transcript_7938:81-1355(+)
MHWGGRLRRSLIRGDELMRTRWCRLHDRWKQGGVVRSLAFSSESDGRPPFEKPGGNGSSRVSDLFSPGNKNNNDQQGAGRTDPVFADMRMRFPREGQSGQQPWQSEPRTARIYDGAYRMKAVPDHPMFENELTTGMTVSEVRQISEMFRLLRPNLDGADVLEDYTAHKHVAPTENPVFQDEIPLDELPKTIPAELLKQFREDVTPEMALDEDNPWWFDWRKRGENGTENTARGGTGLQETKAVVIGGSAEDADVKTVRRENALWARVDELSGAVTSRARSSRTNANENLKYNPVRTLQEEATRRRKQKYKMRKKNCPLTDNRTGKIVELDFRKVNIWSRFLSEAGRIVPRKHTKTRQRAQLRLSKVIKTARTLGLVSKLSYPFGLVTTGNRAPQPRSAITAAQKATEMLSGSTPQQSPNPSGAM